MYTRKVRIETPPTDCAMGSFEKTAATVRKYAFIVNVETRTNKKNVLRDSGPLGSLYLRKTQRLTRTARP